MCDTSVTRDRAFPVPWRINLSLLVLTFATAIALIGLTAYCDAFALKVLMGIAFSYALLTNYGLLHEAAHDNFHELPRVNYLCGVISGILFPVPFTMIRLTHRGHHRNNRTDAEMFDLYYESDNRLYKFWIWYGTLTGGFWPLVPLGAIIIGLLPHRLYLWLFRKPPWRNPSLADMTDAELWKIRLELSIIVTSFIGIAWLINWQWLTLAICYACFALNWSTRQYVGHAFSKRDVIEGAWNLKHFRWMEWLLLNSNWDLNHHRRPEVPWLHLPRVANSQHDRPSYLRIYWAQWLGPRKTNEPSPDAPDVVNDDAEET